MAAHITKNTEQHISHSKTAFVDTIASIKDSDREVIPVQEVLELLAFMLFWTMLYLKKYWNTPHLFLILLPGSIVKSGLHSIPFFTILRTLLLLGKLAIMAALNDLWHRVSNNIPLACLSLQPL